MSSLAPQHHGLYEALPGRILRSTAASVQTLVGAQARHHLLGLADELCIPVHAVCCECRLPRGDGRVDLAVCLVPMRPIEIDGALGLLGQRHLTAPPWRRCIEFLAEWSHPASRYAAQIPFVCVAFDLPVDRAAVPAPGLSLCIDREFFPRLHGLPVGPPPPVSALVALADDCHRRLHGEAAAAEPLALLASCLSGDEVLAKHLSFMPSRTPPAFKLDIRIPVDAIAALLRRIRWPGPVDSVVARIRALAPRQRHVQLNLVLTPGADANLEVELLTIAAEAGSEERAAVLQQLVDGGHCDPAKADVLRRSSLRPVHRDADGLIVARNWYLKLTFLGSRIVGTKAYLGLVPRVWAHPQSGLDAHESVLGDTA